ncbi:Proton myo-inositol cotransporter [Trichinella pseudospiralis]|uniref:Proton myo-inositol cotransporter n=1 Tax=Trichinella pseudospiralis TaxID=6337 RepID=A0A0V1F257_TRIPS|nr:Proton myo-inositol cotransporter [Trichinella pseudospiralis]
MDSDEVTPTKTTPTLIFLCIMAVVGGFPIGYFTTVISGAMLIIRSQFFLDDQWLQLIVSTTVAAAAIFALVGGWFNQRIGRKKVILVSCLFYIIGCIVISVATNKEAIVAGRFLHGIAIGLSSCTIPPYLAECVPTNIRGRLLILFPVLIAFGQWIACMFAASLSYMQDKNCSWRIMFAIGGIPVLIKLFGFPFMPESPRWLVSKGYIDEAFKVLKSIYGKTDKGIAMAQMNINSMTETSNAEESRSKKRECMLFKLLRNRASRKALILTFASIVRMGGIKSESTAMWMSAVIAGANFFGTALGVYLIERLGRRTLVFFSMLGVIVGLLLMGIGCDDCSYDPNCGFCFNSAAYHPQLTGTCVSISKNGSEILSTEYALYGRCSKKVNNQNFKSSYNAPNVQFDYGFCTTRYSWIPILAMTSFLCFFSIGLGGIPWTVNAEIYPNWARSCGNSLATFVNWMFNLITAQTFLTLTKQITREGVFFMYSGFTVFGTITLYLLMPETKGVPIDNIETVLEGPWIYKSILKIRAFKNIVPENQPFVQTTPALTVPKMDNCQNSPKNQKIVPNSRTFHETIN